MSSLSSCQPRGHGRRIGFHVDIFKLTSLCLIILTTGNNVVAQPQQQSSNFLEDDTCLDNYDISAGSIIRTHDSQKLGAKYINESDLGYVGSGVKSREECLKLCCRTPKCTVIVFEEKNSGSCYLFDCGTPEDFRCKFTTQPHYTSAILRKPNLNQHENELNQLRSGDVVKGNLNPSNNNNNNNGNVVKVTNEHQQHHETENEMLKTTTTTVPVAQPIVNTNSLQPQPKLQLQLQQQQKQQQEEEKKQQDPQTLPSQQQQRQSKCDRNQFECKSNSECIAIYNVCDAIPQCMDGSDEAPELNCPAPDAPNESQPVQKVQVSSVPGSAMNGKGGDSVIHNTGQEGIVHSQHGSLSQQEFLPSQQQQQSIVPLSSGPIGISSNNNNNNNNNNNVNANGKTDQIVSTQQMFQSQHSPIFNHKNSGVMEENYGSQRSPYWKPTFDYPLSSGDLNNNNNNNNGYNPINPAAGLYGGGSGNMNNAYSSSSSSSYTYPQYPSQGIQSPFSQQQQQQQQYLPYNPNNLNVNNLQLQPQQQSSQQQQILQNNPYYNSNSNINNMNNVRPGSTNVNNQNMNVGLSNQNSVFTNNSPSRILPLNNNNNINNNNNNRLVIPQGNSPVVSLQQQLANQPVNAVSNNASFPTTRTTNNGSSASAIQVSFNEISKLEIPQSFRKLSSQIQSFAAEAESDLSDHTAGGGAVLVFIMGICMSACMVVIVGCRLRKIGNRRRGKNRLDSDYLVDGMYL